MFCMKWLNCFLLLFAIWAVSETCWAVGFLKAQSFPGTFQDLSFETRLDVLAAGYDELDVTFDASGRCVSGCPYVGITIEQLDVLLEENANEAEKAIEAENQKSKEMSGNIEPLWSWAQTERRCSQYSRFININNTIPVQAPLDVNWYVSAKFGQQRVRENTTTSHRGIDLAVPVGTPIYAPASGRVVSVWTNSESCGRGYMLDHGGGWKTQYCHLDSLVVQYNDYVQAGCLIGMSGNTGRSTGPHLHYSIFYEGQPIDPQKYLVH